MTREGWRGGRWTAGTGWTGAVLGCLLLTAHEDIRRRFSLYSAMIYPSPLRSWHLLRGSEGENCDSSLDWRRSLSPVSKRGQGQSWRGSPEKLAVCAFSHDSPESRTKAGRLLRWNPTYASCPAAVSSSGGTGPGLLTWLRCNYSDAQPLTATAALPVDQSGPFLARRACGCEKYRVYAI